MLISRCIWLWQNIFSPHMAGLAVDLARRGYDVTYVAEHAMTDDRVQQGWAQPSLVGVSLKLMASVDVVATLVASAPPESIHLCSGVRGNGLVGVAQRVLRKRGLRQWVVMETVDDSGWRGAIKRLEYRRLFLQSRQHLQGILCIGHRTPAWVVACGAPSERVFPFAYFLPKAGSLSLGSERKPGPFRFVFAGRLIPLKRVDWLMNALADLADPNFELWIVGAGPEEPALRALADHALSGRVRWLGQLPLPEVPAVMAQADCLVLPSVHDGWGAVVSEALMVGTPVICSDACGAAGVVRASGYGGMFCRDDRVTLSLLLKLALQKGPLALPDRISLARWAECLGSSAGAAFLLRLLGHVDGNTASSSHPSPPWAAEPFTVYVGLKDDQ